jgi:hypothetical protein
MSSASLNVLALVSGLPSGRRGKRLLFMLQAFVDDSRSFTAKPAFVLGGYLAEVDTWLRFSDDWQKALDSAPAVKVFKMTDALKNGGGGELYGMSEASRLQKIATMRRVVEDHIRAEFSVAFRIDQYQAAHANWGKPHQNPYYFAMAVLIGRVVRNIEKFGFSRQPVDFIFDRQDMEMDKALAGWKWAVEVSRPDPPDLLELLPNPPTFRSDSDILPLQAADMQAVWVRKTFNVDNANHTPPPMPGSKKQIWGMIHSFNEQELRRDVALTEARLKKAFDEGRLMEHP